MTIGLLSFASLLRQKGNLQLNVGDLLLTYPFLNFFQNANVFLNSGATLAFDTNNNPTGTLSGGNMAYFPGPLPPSAGNDQWVIGWGGTVSPSGFNGLVAGDLSVVSQSAGTSIAIGGGNTAIITGTDVRVVFTFNDYALGVNGYNMNWLSGTTFTGFNGLYLCRLKDEAALLAGGIWRPEYLNTLRFLNPGVLRFMGVICNSGVDTLANTNWNYRLKLGDNAAGSGNKLYDPRIWCSSITASGNAYSSTAYNDMPATWTDAEIFMGNMPSTPALQNVLSVQTSNGLTTGKVQLNFAAAHGLTTNQVVSYSGYDKVGAGLASPSQGTYKITSLSTTAIELTTLYPTSSASILAGNTVTSGSYNPTTGQVTLNLTSNPGGDQPSTISVSCATGTGGFAGINGVQTVTGYGTNQVSFTIATGLTMTITGGIIVGSSFGQVSSATINVGSRGAKALVQFPFNTPTNLNSSSNGLCVFSYDQSLDVVLANPGPLYCGLSWDYCINLCNTLSMDFWANTSCVTGSAMFTAQAQYAAANLNANLNCYPEWSNEIFNFVGAVTPYCWYKGLSMGWPFGDSSIQLAFGFQGVRSTMYAQAMQSAWSSAGRASSSLKCLLGTIEVAGGVGIFQPFTCNGQYNDASIYPLYSAYTGGISRNAFPNRPIDIHDGITYADYLPGVDPGNDPGLYTWAQQLAAGSTSTALANLDAEFRANQATAAGSGGLYQAYENMVAGYDGSGRPSGKSNLVVCGYEGYTSFTTAGLGDYQNNSLTKTGTVTFNIGSSPGVNWPAHGLQNGFLINFSGLPGGWALQNGLTYVVMNATANAFDVSTSRCPQALKAINLTPSISGTFTATAATCSIDNLAEAWYASTLCIPTCMDHFNSYLNKTKFPHSIFSSALQIETENTYGLQPQIMPWAMYEGDIEATPFLSANAYSQWNAVAH